MEAVDMFCFFLGFGGNKRLKKQTFFVFRFANMKAIFFFGRNNANKHKNKGGIKWQLRMENIYCVKHY